MPRSSKTAKDAGSEVAVVDDRFRDTLLGSIDFTTLPGLDSAPEHALSTAEQSHDRADAIRERLNEAADANDLKLGRHSEALAMLADAFKAGDHMNLAADGTAYDDFPQYVEHEFGPERLPRLYTRELRLGWVEGLVSLGLSGRAAGKIAGVSPATASRMVQQSKQRELESARLDSARMRLDDEAWRLASEAHKLDPDNVPMPAPLSTPAPAPRTPPGTKNECGVKDDRPKEVRSKLGLKRRSVCHLLPAHASDHDWMGQTETDTTPETTTPGKPETFGKVLSRMKVDTVTAIDLATDHATGKPKTLTTLINFLQKQLTAAVSKQDDEREKAKANG